MKKTLIPMMLITAALLTGCGEITVNGTDEITGTMPSETTIATFAEVVSTDAQQDAVAVTNVNETYPTPVIVVEDNDYSLDNAPDADTPEVTAAAVVEPEITETVTDNMSPIGSALQNYPAYRDIATNIKSAVMTNSSLLYDYSPSIDHYREVCTLRYMEEGIIVSLYDVNNDGTPELFFSRYTNDYTGYLILEMYTMCNGSAVRVISSEYYESYAYCDGVGIVLTDDSQITDVLSFNGTSLDVIATYGPDDNFTYTRDLIPGTWGFLSVV